MRTLVLDASVVLKWFRAGGERHLDAARSVREAFERGELLVLVPPLLGLEIVNVAARRWGWSASELAELASALEELGLETCEPELAAVASWSARGLTAYDATYVALAEAEEVELLTDDETIVSVASEVAVALDSWEAPPAS